MFAYNNCAKTSGGGDGGGTALACQESSIHAARVTAYGIFDPLTHDMCHAFTGTSPRWTGMSTTIGHIALPPAGFDGGTACGTCVEIKGPLATLVSRVSLECPGCAADQIDIDTVSFNTITGGGGSGIYDVEVRPIPCPVTESVRYSMNSGTNPFYLNLSPANFRHPIDTLQVNFGSGFTAMARGSNSNDFSISMASAVAATVKIKATDIFGQAIQSTVDTAPAATTLTTEQFGDCQ